MGRGLIIRYVRKPFVSVIDGQLKTGKTDRHKIPIKYEPQRTRAGIADTPHLIPVTINGKKQKINYRKIEQEYEL